MTSAITIGFALVGFALFFFILKRMVRMALRLALIGAFLFALVVGAIAWWWFNPLGNASTPNAARPQAPSAARPTRK